MKYVAMIIILAIVGFGLGSNWVVTSSTDITAAPFLGFNSVPALKVFQEHKLTVQAELTFMDGMKNGIRACATFLSGALVSAYSLYVALFPQELIWKIVWAILGIPLSFIGGVAMLLLGAIPLIVKRLLLVPADWSYYCGFISACLVFIGAIAVVSREKIQSRRSQA
ncbi:hypothetical protein [Sporomusa sphaeroides]|uniref:Uncharacterized protein n=1 Tax=Sporomusa sphaeroides DSM 2875 TaxID=1337886 RepID=A0ABM9W9N3_9FIRM|nr:hypothetical protein [Sporomusa sphaeroides]OLS54437.1 hypothetical protein SPSPH_45190 [Sporomusa sphaeroides DSM 2875]CVK21871.1 hypothetical protein SSPH_04589 [Sporomusa sphaeroides DSM 2875]